MRNAILINLLLREKLLEISDVRNNDDWTLLSGNCILMQQSVSITEYYITIQERICPIKL